MDFAAKFAIIGLDPKQEADVEARAAAAAIVVGGERSNRARHNPLMSGQRGGQQGQAEGADEEGEEDHNPLTSLHVASSCRT